MFHGKQWKTLHRISVHKLPDYYPTPVPRWGSETGEGSLLMGV